MSPTTRRFYNLQFEVLILKLRGDAYQDLFSTVMELAHPGDFVRVRPWGKQGDRKNDGFLKSERHLFQVYAPNELKEAEAKRKIREDYTGAVPHWDEHFDRWSFVHNATQGVSPGILDLLLELAQGPPPRTLEHFGPSELHTKLFSLGPDEIERVLGPPVSAEPASALQFDEIRVILERVSAPDPDPTSEVAVVPPGKLDANGFNENSRELLRFGRARSLRVARFLETYRFDPELGARVSEALKAEYARLKTSGLDPNDVLSGLFAYVSDHRSASQVAAMAVLAHFFDACDIFEAPAVVTVDV